MDFLNSQGELKGFDVCIDKGTFDAVSLNPDNTNQVKKLYVEALQDALKDQGHFAITSCNWTKEQLLDRFSDGEGKCIMKLIIFGLIIYFDWLLFNPVICFYERAVWLTKTTPKYIIFNKSWLVSLIMSNHSFIYFGCDLMKQFPF